jgi:hypothetical protein
MTPAGRSTPRRITLRRAAGTGTSRASRERRCCARNPSTREEGET